MCWLNSSVIAPGYVEQLTCLLFLKMSDEQATLMSRAMQTTDSWRRMLRTRSPVRASTSRLHNKLDPDQRRHLRSGAFTGWEIVDNTARLCAMNLLLHGIESPESDGPINVADALISDPGDRFDMVPTNPPFVRKSSMYIINEEGDTDRQSLAVLR